MAEGYCVKGSTLNSKFEFVRDRFGDAACDSLRSAATENGLPKFFDSGWYPFEQYCQLLRLIAETHFAGDVRRLAEVGEYSAEVAFGSTYKGFASRGDFTTFLKSIGALHRMFYNQGQITVEIDEDSSQCSIRQLGKPTIAEEDLQVAKGFYRAAARHHGQPNATVDLSRDGAGVTFHLKW